MIRNRSAKPRFFLRPAAVLIAALVPVATIEAHHSPSIYDLTSEISISGVVTRYEWSNPHAYIFVTATEADGNQRTWEVEGSALSMMRRRGWSSTTLSAGDVVTISGNPGRDEAAIIRLRELRMEDGAVVRNQEGLFDSPSTPLERATSLDGVWVAEGSGQAWRLFTDPRLLSLTPAGIAAAREFVEPQDSHAIDCIPNTIPMMMLLPDVKLIELEVDVVRIRGEYDASTRTIYLDGSTHAGASPDHLGHSIGRWEGETLVIDTAAYLPHSQGIATRLRSSSGKRTIERLRLNPDGLTFSYSVVVEDPEILSEPASGEMLYHYRPDLEYTEVSCDLENARRFLERVAPATVD